MQPRSTRGKTRPGRLDALDLVLARLDPAPTPCASALAWDLGFGADPCTSLSWLEKLRSSGWNARLLGLEADRARARYAQRSCGAHCHFAHLSDPPPPDFQRAPRWIRAMNLLRQYPAKDSPAWHQRWGQALADGGHLMEGTCSGDGSVLVAHWMRKQGPTLRRHGLIFSTDFSSGFAPLLFGDRLPKDLRAHARQAGPIGDFFRLWTKGWQSARAQGHTTPLASFLASAQFLDQHWGTAQAFAHHLGASMIWTPLGGVPQEIAA